MTRGYGEGGREEREWVGRKRKGREKCEKTRRGRGKRKKRVVGKREEGIEG